MHDDGVICQICGEAVSTADTVYCRDCDTPHHRECWDFVGSCATFGCGGTEFSTEPPTGTVKVWVPRDDELTDGPMRMPTSDGLLSTVRPHVPDIVALVMLPLLYPGIFFAMVFTALAASEAGVWGAVVTGGSYLALLAFLRFVTDRWVFDLERRQLIRRYEFPLLTITSDVIPFAELTQLRIQNGLTDTVPATWGLYVSYRGWTFNVSGDRPGTGARGQRPPDDLRTIVTAVLQSGPIGDGSSRRRPSLPPASGTAPDVV